MGGGATNLPPGFHFFPSDEDLVVHFLRRKAANLPCRPDIVPTILLHRYDPWELNGTALQAGNQWYFFSSHAHAHAHAAAGQTRTSPSGYWNPAGADETVVLASSGRVVGLKKTLVFCTGEPFRGFRTNWVMHEYHLHDGPGCNVGGSSGATTPSSSSSSASSRRSQRKRVHSSTESNSWVICRVFESSCGSQVSFHDEGTELSCLDEVFLSLDDYDEVSLPNN
ncbi:NAC domain-containing protein 104 [Zea mays]|uniref:NAC domain-containing protein 104 n=1 Tax=Zea mays TaxID=4577 RepID=A0A3L6EQ80_MAIZE|nr:NAC domain-containing protein 104 [Zea mays]